MNEMAAIHNGLMSIGQLAREAGVAATALRYYEREGVLAPTVRSRAGYRLYSREAVEQLGFIRSAQAVGFTLDDIRAGNLVALPREITLEAWAKAWAGACTGVVEHPFVPMRLGEQVLVMVDPYDVQQELSEANNAVDLRFDG